MRQIDTQRLERIKAWMQSYVDRRLFPGNTCLIRQGGHDVFFHAAGHRDVDAGLPFERDTVVRIYSMTKPITSVALMMLVEEGLIHLDLPLSEVLPEFKDMQALVPGATRLDQVEATPTPTLHHCLTHTSGLSYVFNPGPVPAEMAKHKIEFKPRGRTLSEEVTALAALPLAFKPGRRWEYSCGIDVIGRVIEVVSGQSLDRFFDDRIFGPLGMKDTAFAVSPDRQDRFACLYTPLAGDAMALNAPKTTGGDTLRMVDHPSKSPFLDPTLMSGGGGLTGTIDDYMTFAEMLRCGGSLGGERLLSPSTLDFMMRNHLDGDIASMGPSSFAEQPMDGTGFGIGGSVVLDPARARVPGSAGDFSWGGMASTIFWMDRSNDMSVVFFTQLSPSSSYPNRPQLKALVHGALI